MKKTVCVSLALVLVLTLCACGGKTAAPEKSLYAHGLEIIGLMTEMARNEEYMQLRSGSGEISQIVSAVGTGDFTQPKAVYAITGSEDLLAAYSGAAELENASERLQKLVSQQALGALMIQVNGLSGVNNLAASSACTAGKTFVSTKLEQDTVYLYTYENAVPVAVTFSGGEDNSVSASGTFVLHDEFPCDSAEAIKEFFGELSLQVTEVPAE